MTRKKSFFSKKPVIEKKPVFSEDDLLQAKLVIESFDFNPDEILPYALILAGEKKQSAQETAFLISKAISGSGQGFIQIHKIFGISPDDLKKYGAVLRMPKKDMEFRVNLTSRKFIDLAQAALLNLIKKEFGNGQ